MSANRLVEALSRQTHIPLACAPEVRDDILLLQVRDLPLENVLARIAEVAGARWRKIGQTWVLERPNEMARAQQERDVQARAAIIARSLAQILSPLQKPWNEATLRALVPRRRKMEQTGQQDLEMDVADPVYRAFLRCLSDIPADTLARIPAGGRVVFATEPTPMEKPLGRGAQIALAKLAEEQRLFGTTLRNAGMKDGFEDSALSESVSQGRHDLWRRLNPYRTSPVRALLSVERKWQDSYEAHLTLLDSQRQATVQFDVSDEYIPLCLSEPEKALAKNSPHIPLSARSRLWFSIRRGESAKPQLAPDTMRLLTDPDQYEPLSMVVSDGYIALARARNRNLIAALPDALFDESLQYSGDGAITLNDVQNWPRFGTQMRIVDRNGWLIVTPPYPYEARLNYIDRTTLGRIVRRVAQRGSYQIEDIAEFAANAGEAPMYHFGNGYLWAVSKGSYSSGAYGNWTLLALYGTLTADQQRLLRTGQPLPYKNLTERQCAYAKQAVFGARYNYSMEGTSPVPKAFADLSSEPTESYPTGLPGEGAIRVSHKRERIVYFRGVEQKEEDQSYWAMFDRPFGAYSGPPPTLPAGGVSALRYDVRYNMRITIAVDVSPWTRMSEDYAEADAPPTGPPIPFSQLSPDLQKRVNEELLTIHRLRGEAPL